MTPFQIWQDKLEKYGKHYLSPVEYDIVVGCLKRNDIAKTEFKSAPKPAPKKTTYRS